MSRRPRPRSSACRCRSPPSTRRWPTAASTPATPPAPRHSPASAASSPVRGSRPRPPGWPPRRPMRLRQEKRKSRLRMNFASPAGARTRAEPGSCRSQWECKKGGHRPPFHSCPARLYRVVHIELDRVRGHLEALDLGHLELEIGVDHVVREDAALFQEVSVLVEVVEGLAQAPAHRG